MAITQLALEVLTSEDADLIEYAERISGLDGIEGVLVELVDADEGQQTIEVDVEGQDLSFIEIKAAIEGLGGYVNSVDQVSAGQRRLV